MCVCKFNYSIDNALPYLLLADAAAATAEVASKVALTAASAAFLAVVVCGDCMFGWSEIRRFSGTKSVSSPTY